VLLACALLMRVLRCSAARAHSDHLAPRCLGRVSGCTSSGLYRLNT